MRRLYRIFSSILLAAALFAPLFATGCVIHTRNRGHEEEEEQEREHRRDYHDQYRYQYQFDLQSARGQTAPRGTYGFIGLPRR